MGISKSDYSKMADKASPNSPKLLNAVKAFLFGGGICLLGQLLNTLFESLVWGVYSVLVRQLGHMGYRTIPLTCRIFGYGLLFLLVPAVIEGFPSGLSVWTQPVHLANLLFLGLCASATCFVTWNRAVFLLGPVKTSVYIYATPVITIVSSALILHETMTPIMWLGTVLALGGLILSEHREKEKTTA